MSSIRLRTVTAMASKPSSVTCGWRAAGKASGGRSSRPKNSAPCVSGWPGYHHCPADSLHVRDASWSCSTLRRSSCRDGPREGLLAAAGPAAVAATEPFLAATVFAADRTPAGAALAVTFMVALVAASSLRLIRRRRHDRPAQQPQHDPGHQPPPRPRPGHEAPDKTIKSRSFHDPSFSPLLWGMTLSPPPCCSKLLTARC